MTAPSGGLSEKSASHSGVNMHAESQDSSMLIQIGQAHLAPLGHEFDVDALVALSPPVAARELTQLPHHRAASVLGRAPVGDSAEVLDVLLLENEGLAVSLLAAISRARAKEIIDAMTFEGEWLKDLPTAAKAIEDCERRERRLLGESVRPLAHAAPSKRPTEGYDQSFKNGLIHWSARGGAQATTGEISEYHVARGGSGSRLGFPLTPEMDAARSSPFETDGRYQRFESHWDYRPETCQRLDLVCGATVYWSKHGAHATWGGIGEYYETIGGTNGPLGFPVADEVEIGPTDRKAGDGAVGWCQRFEGGTVYWSEKTKAVAVHSPVADYRDRHTGLGFPVSPMIKATTNEHFGTEGRFQRFEAWEDYPGDILTNWSDSEGPGGATIYTSGAHGTHCVGWGNGVFYERLGGTSSWLGFPKSDEADARAAEDEPRSTIQEFEGGAIFFKEGHGSVPVSGAIMEYLSQHGGLRQRLGFPVKEARSLVSGHDEQVQFFEHGIVTVRNSVTEVWVRPAQDSGPVLSFERRATPSKPVEIVELTKDRAPRRRRLPYDANDNPPVAPAGSTTHARVRSVDAVSVEKGSHRGRIVYGPRALSNSGRLRLVKWHREVNQRIKVGDLLYRYSDADRAVSSAFEVRADTSGILREVRVGEGEVFEPQSILAHISL